MGTLVFVVMVGRVKGVQTSDGRGGGEGEGLEGEEWVVGWIASEHQRKKGRLPNARLFYFDRGRQAERTAVRRERRNQRRRAKI